MQYIGIIDVFFLPGFGLKLGQVIVWLKIRRHFLIVCNGVKQSLTGIGRVAIEAGRQPGSFAG
jgi:hypothetical protein